MPEPLGSSEISFELYLNKPELTLGSLQAATPLVSKQEDNFLPTSQQKKKHQTDANEQYQWRRTKNQETKSQHSMFQNLENMGIHFGTQDVKDYTNHEINSIFLWHKFRPEDDSKQHLQFPIVHLNDRVKH
ncbi:hypothetical protein FRC12_016180 [Ceratobasidium sp. 428]|nr:hypothetical protein FRC12_016180 [Ceratobasidium sp. 428]